MARYSGDQIANSPEVVANYLRTAPTTRIATRQIQFLKVHSNSTDFGTQSELPNSNFSKAVRGIQAQAEVVIIGSPNGGSFMIAVYADTFNDGNLTDPLLDTSYSANAYKQAQDSFVRTLAQSVNASVGCTDADVDLNILFGTGFVEAFRAINYVDPTATPPNIGDNYSYNGRSSYENELQTNNGC